VYDSEFRVRYGFIVPVLGLLPGLMYEAARTKYPNAPATAWGHLALGGLIAAVACAVIGRAANGTWRGGVHTLWTIPIQFWAVPYLLAAAAALSTGYKLDTKRWRVTPRRGVVAPEGGAGGFGPSFRRHHQRPSNFESYDE